MILSSWSWQSRGFSLLVVITRDFPLFGIFATNLAQKRPLRKSTDKVPTLYIEIRCDFNETSKVALIR